jgi:hypothetical protein
LSYSAPATDDPPLLLAVPGSRPRFHARDGVLAPHLRSQLLDFRQIALHLTPPVPQSIIRAGMKSFLERSHTVFLEQREQLLFYYGRRIVECQQVRKGVCIVGWFGQHSICIKCRYFVDRLGHQMVGGVAVIELSKA